MISQPTSANSPSSVEDDREKLMEADPNTPIVLGPPSAAPPASYGSIS